jgi:hypothetical protein
MPSTRDMIPEPRPMQQFFLIADLDFKFLQKSTESLKITFVNVSAYNHEDSLKKLVTCPE